MKYFILVLLLAGFSQAALADNVTIVRDGDTQVRNLPGNAQIVTGGGDTVVIQGDDDIWRTMLLGPRVRVQQGGGNSVSATCPSTLSSRDRNKCIREFTRAQEKIRRRFND